MVAAMTIQKPQTLSLKTALQLFDLNITPVASYGIELVWDELSVDSLDKLNQVKATFLKRTLGLRRTAKNRLVYLSGMPVICGRSEKKVRPPPHTAI